MSDVADRVKKIVVEHLGVDEEKVVENASFIDDIAVPSYDVSVGFDSGPSSISSSVYMGPLDYDHIKTDAPPLDTAMNWGFSLIKPINS